MKKSIKIVFIVLMILAMVFVAMPVFADEETETVDVTGKPSTIAKPKTSETATDVKNVGDTVLGVIRVVGTIVAIGMIIVLGIKYMMGSAEERAEYKKTLFPYLIGAILIFAASNLADMIYGWVNPQ